MFCDFLFNRDEQKYNKVFLNLFINKRLYKKVRISMYGIDLFYLFFEISSNYCANKKLNMLQHLNHAWFTPKNI